MLSKLQIAKDLFHRWQDVFICPICGRSVFLSKSSLKCPQNHQFDFSRKGCIRLLRQERSLNDDFYDLKLFQARRSFILAGFYDELHKEITKILKKQKSPLILDLGCGEGTHLHTISKQLKDAMVIGCDLSPKGIQIATDYLKDNYLPIVADVNHLPFKDSSFDAIVDILSPFMYQEVLRVLKPNGIFIKVSPTSSYLKEVRTIYGLKEYEKEGDVLNNLEKHFIKIHKKTIENKYPLTEKYYKDLIYMTPLMHHEITKFPHPIKNISISLNIYVIKKEEQ